MDGSRGLGHQIFKSIFGGWNVILCDPSNDGAHHIYCAICHSLGAYGDRCPHLRGHSLFLFPPLLKLKYHVVVSSVCISIYLSDLSQSLLIERIGNHRRKLRELGVLPLSIKAVSWTKPVTFKFLSSWLMEHPLRVTKDLCESYERLLNTAPRRTVGTHQMTLGNWNPQVFDQRNLYSSKFLLFFSRFSYFSMIALIISPSITVHVH